MAKIVLSVTVAAPSNLNQLCRVIRARTVEYYTTNLKSTFICLINMHFLLFKIVVLLVVS